MNELLQIAERINQDFTNHASPESSELMISLYGLIEQYGTKSIIALNDPQKLQVIGTAFSHIAMNYDLDEKKTINLKASEYSYYTLSKSFIEFNNINALPPLLTLLILKPELVHHIFLGYSCKTIEGECKSATASVLQAKLSKMHSFNKQIYDLIEYTAYYVCSFLFDLDKDSYTPMAKSAAILPSKEIIYKHILPLYNRYNHSWLINEGAKNFQGVYQVCTQILEEKGDNK